MDVEYSRKIEHLYIQLYDQLFIYGRCVFQNDALAEEAVQETFRIACMKPEALWNSENPEGWVVITLKNVISNMQRNRATASRILVGYIEKQAKELAISEDQMDFSLIYGGIAESEEFHLIKEMVLEGKSHLEMARERGITVDACKKRVQRAKEILRKKIEKD